MEDIYLDSDFIISFIKSTSEDYFHIFQEVCRGYRFIAPREVQTELNRREERIVKRFGALVKYKDVEIFDMRVDEMAYVFKCMLMHRTRGHKGIGSGEAAAIALCADRRGVLASNNMRDVAQQISNQKLKHITTSRVLGQAYVTGLISLEKAEMIWADMLTYRTFLPDKSFSSFLVRNETWPLE